MIILLDCVFIDANSMGDATDTPTDDIMHKLVTTKSVAEGKHDVLLRRWFSYLLYLNRDFRVLIRLDHIIVTY